MHTPRCGRTAATPAAVPGCPSPASFAMLLVMGRRSVYPSLPYLPGFPRPAPPGDRRSHSIGSPRVLNPPKGDRSGLVFLDDRFPQVAVGYWLAFRVEPVVVEPFFPPAVPEAVHQVGGVADDLQRAFEFLYGVEGGGQLHPLVGAALLRAAPVPTAGDHPPPSARTGVTGTSSIRVNDGAVQG